MILCARSMSTSSEQSTKRRTSNENMRKVVSFYSQNNKTVCMILKYGRHILKKFTGCAKVCGLFFLIVLLGR